MEILRTIDIGVSALSCHPVKSNKRNEGKLNRPLYFAGAHFESGQYLYADENGIIVAKNELELS